MSHAVLKVSFVSETQTDGHATGLDIEHGKALGAVMCPSVPAGIFLALAKVRVVQHTFPVKLSVKEPPCVGALAPIPLVLAVLESLEDSGTRFSVVETLKASAIDELDPSLN